MSTKTASKARAKFDVALSTLNALAKYAREADAPAPRVQGLTPRAHAFLLRTAGKDIARSWVTVFDDTIDLVNQFNDKDLADRDDVDDREIERVAESARRATSALTDRLNGLA